MLDLSYYYYWNPLWTSSVLVGNSSPVGVEEIPLCSRGVSDSRVASPGPVFTSDGRIRKQPCGRYDSNPSCLYLALRHGPLQHFCSPKGRATPLGNARNINSILRLSRLWYSSILYWGAVCLVKEGHRWTVQVSVRMDMIGYYSVSLALFDQLIY